MRRIGLVGGTTWHSTEVYYRLLNEGVQARLGGVASADLLLASLNFAEVARNNKDDMPANGRLVADASHRLALAGAEGLVLCANTMHMFAEEAVRASGLQIVHVVDAVAAVCHERGFTTVGLLGTRYTMEMDFFRDRLASLGIKWLLPLDEDRVYIHDKIFAEMALGEFTDSTRAEHVRIISELSSRGAQAVILGCTELPILIRPEDTDLPTLDTTAIHADAALDFMLPQE